jgi:hypothetical protein
VFNDRNNQMILDEHCNKWIPNYAIPAKLKLQIVEALLYSLKLRSEIDLKSLNMASSCFFGMRAINVELRAPNTF